MIRTISFVLCIALIGGAAAQPKVPTPVKPKTVETKAIPGTLVLEKWKTTGPVQFTISDKDAPGTESKALRAEVGLTYEAWKKRSYTAQTIELPEPQDWSAWNRFVLWVFVERSKTMRGGGVSGHLFNADDKLPVDMVFYKKENVSTVSHPPAPNDNPPDEDDPVAGEAQAQENKMYVTSLPDSNHYYCWLPKLFGPNPEDGRWAQRNNAEAPHLEDAVYVEDPYTWFGWRAPGS